MKKYIIPKIEVKEIKEERILWATDPYKEDDWDKGKFGPGFEEKD